MPMFDSTIGARFPNPKIEARFGADTMPETADNIAKDMGVRREASDKFALASQQNYEAARAAGFFEGEIAPVEIAQGRGKPPLTVANDEHPRPQTDLDSLAKLKPLFEGGVVTAGNASGINDGAAALLIGSAAIGERLGLKPRGRIVSAAIAGVAPRVMGLGPVPASKKALERAGLRLNDIDVIEINEAFATQVLGCLAGPRPRGGRCARQSQWRRHRRRPSPRRLGRASRADGAATTRAERRALRAGIDVHRRRPGHCGGDRARENVRRGAGGNR